ATATDDRDPNPVVTNDAPVVFPSGSDTVVTFTVTDESGNESTGTATVTVKAFVADVTAPVLTLPNDIEVESEAEEGTSITNAQIAAFLNAAAATDDQDPSPVVTHDAPALFPQGQRTVVTFTATDETGNGSTGTATVTVEPFTILLPPIEIKTEVRADPETTVIVDVEGVIIELVDAPVVFRQVEERIVLVLPVPPDTGKLVSFTDPTTGIIIEGTTFTIPIRDDENNVVFTFTGVLEEAPVGGQAIAKELRLQTAEEAGTVDLTGLDPRAGEVTVVLDTEVVSLTESPVINLEVGTDIAPDIQFQFGQLAKDNARQVSGDVGAVLTVDTNLDNRDALVTFKIGSQWMREVVLSVTPSGVFDPDDLSLINDVIFIGRLSDTGEPQLLDASCTGPDGDGRWSCTANSPAGLSIFGLLALPPVEHDAVPIFVLDLPDDIDVEVDTVGGARLENAEIQGFLDSALTGQESAVEVFVAEPVELPPIFAQGDNRLIFGGTDELGNFATDFATITVVHELPPILHVPDSRVIDSQEPLAASDPSLQEFLNEALASAALEGALVVTNDAPDPFPFGDTVVTFTATDNTGKRSSASVTFTVNQVTPDVRVTGVKVTPSSVIGDRPVTVAVQVENFGTAPGPFLLEIRLDDQVIQSVSGTLIPGESQTITREIVGQTVGEHRVEVAGTAATFLVKAELVADIRVVDLEVRPVSAESSAEFSITLRVENAGGAAGERGLVLLLDGQVLEEVTVSLAPGARETIERDIRQALVPGDHVVKVGGVSARFQVVESGAVAPVAGQPGVTPTSPEATLPAPSAQATSAPVQPAPTLEVASTPETVAPQEAITEEGGLSGGALAGIIGGVLVVVAALAIGIVMLLRRRPSPVAEVEPEV
ncbi:MAG: hypothetical protein IIC97_03635, partial [Chloroflexi bacterium]|nr:hypothetical protein [Chloroflexota bacterium]